MRGMFTAGVLDVLMEEGVHADCVVGVSAGALFGVNFLSGQRGRAVRYNKRFNSDKNYMGLRPLLREGNIISTEYAYENVPHTLDPFDNDAFMRSGIPFYAVVTNVADGNPEYIRISSVFRQMDVLRASGSMPFVSHPVELDGKKYLDGGISDSIPFPWMLRQGMDKMVVVLTQDAGYVKKPLSRFMVAAMGLRYPAIAKQLARRHQAYNDARAKLAQLERAGKAFVIRPSRPVIIGTTEGDPVKIQQIYDLGRSDAKKILPELKRYLES